MSDASQPPTSALVIPPETQQKFAPLLELIQGSESMNNEERQYWINILPIMTADQLKNLEEILSNEKQQLAAIDAKYSKEVAAVSNANVIASMEQKIRSKTQQRQRKEAETEATEEAQGVQILEQIQSL
jgi:hypothetical protein